MVETKTQTWNKMWYIFIFFIYLHILSFIIFKIDQLTFILLMEE